MMLLVRSVEGGKIEEVKKLLDAKANPNECDSQNQSGLHIAALFGRTDILQLFMRYKRIDPNIQDRNGWTPLHCAASRLQLDFCQVLLSNKLVKAAMPNNDQNSPFMYLCKRREIKPEDEPEYFKTLQLFLDRGVDPNGRNKFGETPLHYAAMHHNISACEFLCKVGCNVNALNK
jgi:ankyrin repeat protein